MTLEKFEEIFYNALKDSMEPRGCTVSRTMIHKNNEDLSGIVLCRDYTGVGITLYPKYMYDEWKQGTSIDELIFEVKNSMIFKKIPTIDIHNFDREHADEKVMSCVVGYEKNKEWLKSIPHQRVQDTAIYARWYVENDMSFAVSDRILGQLKMTKEELLTMAQANLRKTATFYPLEKYIFGFDNIAEFQKEFTGSFEKMASVALNSMFILGSSREIQGASVAMDPVVLNAVRECLEDDFYILPASIHETLVIPKSSWNDSIDALRQMVRDVNEKDVPIQDRLTDSVYEFDGHRLKMAGSTENITLGSSMEGYRHRR